MNINSMESILLDIEDISQLLYQEDVKEGYAKLSNMIPKVMELAVDLDDSQQEELISALAPAVSAMENKDSTLLADILQYELGEKLKSFV